MKPFLDSSGVVGDGPELARRMKRDGYLFVRGLLPSEPVESLRMQFLEIGAANGWVSTQVPIEEGVADLTGFCVEPEPKYMEVYEQIYRIQGFHALPHHPRILGLLERMLGEPVIHHPRIIGRFMFPQRNAYTTKAHQDFIPIQGTRRDLHRLAPAVGPAGRDGWAADCRRLTPGRGLRNQAGPGRRRFRDHRRPGRWLGGQQFPTR